MKRVLLTIAYDGTDYHGWQVQPNGITVQEVLQKGLCELLGTKTGATGCSRTDSGVHAKQFCCHVDCDDNIPEDAFIRGLSAKLPSDIAVIDCKTVASDFHARYNALGKTYVYNILNSKIKDPFLERYYWRIERELDIDKMNEFCGKIVGKHDFYAFSSSGRTVEDTVRTVKECFVTKRDNKVKLQITADGFLYNMVRIIVGTAVAVSDGKIDPNDTEKILAEKKRENAGITAPAKGLFLEKVIY
ncbi:MAG: tRNA pseudouridine(38-40) synthase TruA [Clostridia bacterium]|nr:tRNA pseudouridine(38-40) synthase TruA [Clostridia bacterium]